MKTIDKIKIELICNVKNVKSSKRKRTILAPFVSALRCSFFFFLLRLFLLPQDEGVEVERDEEKIRGRKGEEEKKEAEKAEMSFNESRIPVFKLVTYRSAVTTRYYILAVFRL